MVQNPAFLYTFLCVPVCNRIFRGYCHQRKGFWPGEPGIVEKYKEFLSGGNSKDPIDLLKICGVDMTKKEPVEDALCIFEDYLAQLEALMGETK